MRNLIVTLICLIALGCAGLNKHATVEYPPNEPVEDSVSDTLGVAYWTPFIDTVSGIKSDTTKRGCDDHN